MPVVIGVLLVLLAGFQFFFRYEHWPSQKQDGVIYERDKLTGQTHIIQPGEKVDFLARVVGHYGNSQPVGEASVERVIASHRQAESPKAFQQQANAAVLPIETKTEREADDEIYQLNMTEAPKRATQDKLEKQPGQDVKGLDDKALSLAQVEQRRLDRGKYAVSTPQAVASNAISRQFDLNQDGAAEQIIQSVGNADGFLDISIVKEGKEIFYARGRQLQILPTQNRGWLDLALLTQDTQTKQIYRYDNKTAAYVLVGKTPLRVADKT